MPQNFLLFTAFTNKQYQTSLHIVHNTTYFTEGGSISANSVSCSVASTNFLLQVIVASYLSPASDIVVVLVSFFSEFNRLAVSSALIFSMFVHFF